MARSGTSKRPAAPTSARTASDWRRAILTVVAGVGLIGVGVALWLASRPAKVDAKAAADARQLLESAGCSLELTPAAGNAQDHSDMPTPGGTSPAWQTDPPTSGPHYGEPAIYGAYTDPLEQARVVHNLEHGAVVMQYGSGVGESAAAGLRRLYDESPNGLLLAPYPPLGDDIALGAWIAEGGGRGQGVLARCPSFERDAFAAFIAAYRFKGPERIRASSMAPGDR